MPSVYEYATSEASNSTTGGWNTAEGMDPSAVNDGMRVHKQNVSGYLKDQGGVNTVGGTGNDITVTLAAAPVALVDGYRFTFNASAANTGNTTITATPAGGSAFTAKKLLKWEAGSAIEIPANSIPAANALTEVIYDSARDSGNGAFMLLGSSVAAATTSAAGIVEQQFNAIYNIGLATSVGSSALTIALKDADGNDPSTSSPVIIPFRNVTAATGTPSYLTVTAATSLVISSGSTMGFTSASIGRLWIVGFNDGGTFRLGAVNCLSGTDILALRNGIYSSTAEGGAGGADSAQVIYTGTAVSSKAMTILGYLEATEATAGTWATAPSLVKLLQPGDALPSDRLNEVSSILGTVATATTVMPADNTIPQITEGDQLLSKAITPLSGANVLKVVHSGQYASSVGSNNLQMIALFRDSTAAAIGATANNGLTNNQAFPIYLATRVRANSSSSTTFRVRAGPSTAGTITINGQSGSQYGGGSFSAGLTVTEYMA